MDTISGTSPFRRWTIVGLLCIGIIVAYIDRVNLSVVLTLPEFKNMFHLTDQDRGSLNSAFFWTYAVLQIPAGWFVDRYGVKWPYAGGFFLWSLVSAWTGWASSYSMIFGIRLLLGVFESLSTPAGLRWIRYHCSENQRGLAIGLYFAAAKIGPAIGTPLATSLMVTYGWRTMFVMLGLGALIYLAPWVALVKDDDVALAKAEEKKASAAKAISFGQVMASPAIWGTVVGTFCYQYFIYFCMTWMPAYFVERRHLSLDKMGIYTGFSFLGMAVIATLSGWVADRLIERGMNAVKVRKAFTVAGLLMASTELIGAFSDSPSVALFFAIFSLSGLGLTTPNYWALTQSLIPGAAVGGLVGVQNCAASVSGVVAPLLTGWLKQTTGTYEAPMMAVAVFLIIGVLMYLFVVREKYAPKKELR